MSFSNIQLGEPLKGEALRQAIQNQKTGHKTTSTTAIQRLWNGSPLVDPRTGLYYPAGLISCPAPNQDGSRVSPGVATIPAGLATGAIINIKAGTKNGGEFNRRVAVAGGRAYFGRFSLYHNVSIVTEKVNSATSEVVFSWVTGMPAGRSDDLWESPAFSDDGGGGKKFIPEGAVAIVVSTACTVTFGLFADGTERALAIVAAVGAEVLVPPSASYFSTSVASVVYFRLAPL